MRTSIICHYDIVGRFLIVFLIDLRSNSIDTRPKLDVIAIMMFFCFLSDNQLTGLLYFGFMVMFLVGDSVIVLDLSDFPNII